MHYDEQKWQEPGVDTRGIVDKPYRDRIRGGLFGGAVGDALGYPVEFQSWDDIQRKYGARGIREYRLDYETQKAVISDDTQMSLFTANGILIGETTGHLEGIQPAVTDYVYRAYREWLRTQLKKTDILGEHMCWLYEIPELHSCRAPGNTCLSALQSGKKGSTAAPLNSSKGCGGVMRVAPLALHYRPGNDTELRKLDEIGAEIAAITHGHALGYLPAAILTHVISRGVYNPGGMTLKEAVNEAWDAVRDSFEKKVPESDIGDMDYLITKALLLADMPGDEEKHIRFIGGGWSGDEALAIALYCSVRYPDDFSKAVIAAVNHGGDTDSTGAVTGNILGAWLGYDQIEEKWKTDIELKDVLLEMADDLCFGCPRDSEGNIEDENWKRKFCEGHAV